MVHHTKLLKHDQEAEPDIVGCHSYQNLEVCCFCCSYQIMLNMITHISLELLTRFSLVKLYVPIFNIFALGYIFSPVLWSPIRQHQNVTATMSKTMSACIDYTLKTQYSFLQRTIKNVTEISFISSTVHITTVAS